MNLKFLSMVQTLGNDEDHPFLGSWRKIKTSLEEMIGERGREESWQRDQVLFEQKSCPCANYRKALILWSKLEERKKGELPLRRWRPLRFWVEGLVELDSNPFAFSSEYLCVTRGRCSWTQWPPACCRHFLPCSHPSPAINTREISDL